MSTSSSSSIRKDASIELEHKLTIPSLLASFTFH